MTLPGRQPRLGYEHIITQTVDEIVEIFVSMGFQIAFGPEVEWDYYNFEALNIPKDHPARDRWDTLYVGDRRPTGEVLLRTHTSPNQVRVMEKTQPPVRVVVPGQVLSLRGGRRDARVDVLPGRGAGGRRGPDDGGHEGHAHRVRPPDLRARTERCACAATSSRSSSRAPRSPSTATSAAARAAGSASAPAGSRSWALAWSTRRCSANVGYDPSVYSGFAFGMGPERVAMLKHGIDDIRLFYANDLRFLRLFR